MVHVVLGSANDFQPQYGSVYIGAFTYGQMFRKASILSIDDLRLKSWCKTLSLPMPHLVIGLYEQSVAAQRPESIVLSRRLRPIRVCDGGDHSWVADIDDA